MQAFYPTERVYVTVLNLGAHASLVTYSKSGLLFEEYIDNDELELLDD